MTDAYSSFATSNATVTQPAAPLLATAWVISHVTCNGGSDGSATVSDSGGTSPYTYAWSNGATTATITGLTAGTAYVTVTDSHACTATSSATLTQPPPAPASVTGPTPICQNTSGIYSTTTGMSNYLWSVSAGGTISSGGSTTDHFAEVTWNNYGAQSVTVTYTNPPDGCIFTGTRNVTVNQPPTPVISGASVVTQGQTVTYSTPYVAGHSYSWSASHGNAVPCLPNMNCLTITWDFPCGLISPGFVTVTETNLATGCTTTVTLWITINP